MSADPAFESRETHIAHVPDKALEPQQITHAGGEENLRRERVVRMLSAELLDLTHALRLKDHRDRTEVRHDRPVG